MSTEEEAAELHWFAKWEVGLPSPEELMPLSPSSPLALPPPSTSPPQLPPTTPTHPRRPPRSQGWSRPRSSTSGVDAISRLGIKNAVPKTIMQHMNVEGLTRENVASHLQKYRLYLKRMQMQSAASSPPSSAPPFIIDAATDRLFATTPVPCQFLRPFVPVAAAMQPNQYYQQRHVGMMMREYPQMLALKQPMQNPYVQYLASGRVDGKRALNLFPTGLD